MDSQQNAGLAPETRGPSCLRAPLTGTLPAWALQPAETYNWEQVMRVLRKNRRFALAVATLVTAIAAGAAFLMKDIYQPTAKLEIDPPGSSNFTQLREVESVPENNQDYQETQAQILQSDALAIGVIRSLRLDLNPAIVGKKALARYAHDGERSLGSQIPAEPAKVLYAEEMGAGDRTRLESIALAEFRAHLSVNSVRNSRLIAVSYASQDPCLSQQVVNTLISQYIDRNYRTRYSTTMQASQWLSSQLGDIRDKVTQSTQALVDYQKKYGLVEQDDKDLATTQTFVDANQRWVQAKADRLQLEAYVAMLNAGETDSLPQARDNQLHSTLTSRYVESRAQLAQARAIYGDQNANVKKLQLETEELAAQLDADKMRIAKEIRTAYAAALAKEESLQAVLEQARRKMGDVGERMVQYRLLKNEAYANTELYRILTARLKEAAITAGLGANNIRVLDPAELMDHPTGPHRALIIGLGGAIGSFFGLALAFVKESLNNTVRTPDDIREWTGLPSLAMVPLLSVADRAEKRILGSQPTRGSSDRATLAAPLRRPLIMEHEAMKGLRAVLMLSKPGAPPHVVLVASSAAGEGKSTIAISLAKAFAQHGRTCLIDADLRRPAVANAFGLPSQLAGLADVLVGALLVEDVLVTIPEIPGLAVLSAGSLPAKAADSVASEKMKSAVTGLREKFRHIVIDSPPAIPFADARVLSSLADAVVLVGRCGLTTRRAILRCTQLLDEVRAPIFGVVVNGIDTSSADYHYYNYGFSSSLRGDAPYRAHRNTPDSPAHTLLGKSKTAGT